MKGNKRLGLTAELTALIRAENKTDKYSQYFVTSRARRIYSIISSVFPRKTIHRIFDRRTKLSNEVHKLVEEYKPQQVIELACGSSTFGINYTQRYPQVVYIETDMNEVIRKKRIILEQILSVENLKVNPNHILVPIDVLSNDIYKQLQKYVKRGKQTLVVAEGLTSYFDMQQYETFMDNVGRFLDKIGGGYYLSHETFGKRMTSGIGGSILRKLISFLTRSKYHKHFQTKEELRTYFAQKGFRETEHINGNSGSYVYLMEK